VGRLFRACPALRVDVHKFLVLCCYRVKDEEGSSGTPGDALGHFQVSRQTESAG
jgi:hypothetical protein